MEPLHPNTKILLSQYTLKRLQLTKPNRKMSELSELTSSENTPLKKDISSSRAEIFVYFLNWWISGTSIKHGTWCHEINPCWIMKCRNSDWNIIHILKLKTLDAMWVTWNKLLTIRHFPKSRWPLLWNTVIKVISFSLKKNVKVSITQWLNEICVIINFMYPSDRAKGYPDR